MIILYSIVLFGFLIYSFALIDPNLTLVNSPVWASFREVMVNLGYHQRDTSWLIYLLLIVALFASHFYFIRHQKKFDSLRIAFIIGVLLLLSFPFLSRDFFNYIFDARILTEHGANPYLNRPLDFPNDNWLRFMHWTHRTYPYGPAFLPLTLIPSILGFGKFILNYVFFKLLFVGFYIAAVYYLRKMNTTWAMFLATSPLVIVEGVINAHNDLIAVAFALIGFSYVLNKSRPKKLLDFVRPYSTRILLILSAGIKYMTFPTIILQVTKKSHWTHYVSFIGVAAIVAYLSIFKEVQAWYFLNFLIFLPFFYPLIRKSQLLFMGLLLSYYPYIRIGDWTSTDRIALKHNIIIVFFVLNLVYYAYGYLRERKR